ncbi:ABC transporter permease [Phreatobacter sp. AB_2022a]|uniref:ABC transporter permease n=1 Tax=Phreatobacter sp. AB_2022a TaxID=3003134 RepID=UPI002287058B|nr:ABC transporter permease [Phreatobacter sp. AB_2022a]MCZ0737360.1 ABC transporter permease [Phreatobacter sp. AB_2022a]
MKLVLERRAESPLWLALLSPLVAVALTLVAGAILFAVMGKDPFAALKVYFLDPLSDGWALQELTVKATPLALIAAGLCLCYRANVWNIGAEGQYVAGAICGSWLALATHGVANGPWLLPAMLVLGALGGLALALVPAVLKIRFGASEILVSLMLVYVAELALDYLVRGPWRDPKGFNFPQSVNFEPEAVMPLLASGGRMHVGFVIAVVVAVAAAVLAGRTLKGFEIRLVGAAPRAARFAGFDVRRTTLFVFAVSGALAGLAGIIEVAGPIGQLQPSISPGYGFTAIIVAFLGRLNPIGALVAALFLALTFIGGENAQIALRIPLDLTRVFQGLLLFFVLGCDTFLIYRLRLSGREGAA